MAKLVDAPDLGSGVLRRVGSSPIRRTKEQPKGCSFFILAGSCKKSYTLLLLLPLFHNTLTDKPIPNIYRLNKAIILPVGTIILHLSIFTLSYMKILYLQHIPWGWIKQRPHFIAERLSKEYDITVAYRLGLTRKGSPVKNDTTVKLKPLYRLPLERFPAISKINALLYRWQLAKQIKECDIVWFTAPDTLNCCPKKILKDKIVIYDCMDDMLEFNVSQRALDNLKHCEEWLIKNADIVFSTSNFLKNVLTARYLKRDIIVVNNAIKSIEDISISYTPQELKNKETKKFVYIGTISSWFDFETIHTLLNSRKDAEVHLYGIAEIEIPAIERLYFHGAVEHNHIFGIMNSADILLMPFKITPLIESVNPVKLYEYIYSGKPSLAPRYEESEKFEEYVYLYKNQEEFLTLANEILSPEWNHKKSDKDCKLFAANNTWDCRVKQVSKEITEYIKAKKIQ